MNRFELIKKATNWKSDGHTKILFQNAYFFNLSLEEKNKYVGIGTGKHLSFLSQYAESDCDCCYFGYIFHENKPCKTCHEADQDIHFFHLCHSCDWINIRTFCRDCIDFQHWADDEFNDVKFIKKCETYSTLWEKNITPKIYYENRKNCIDCEAHCCILYIDKYSYNEMIKG